MFQVRRRPDQQVDIAQFQDESAQKLSGVNVDGQFFGDARLMTAIIMPEIIANSAGAATANAAAIQAAIGNAAPGMTIQLINDRFYCDQINISATTSALTIQGGVNTVMINHAGIFPNNRYVIVARSGRVGYIDRVRGFIPGDPDIDVFEVVDRFGGVPDNYVQHDVMYLSPGYFQQTVEDSRLAQMLTVEDVTYDGPLVFLTVDDYVSTTMGATSAEAVVENGEVTEINILHSFRTGYRSIFDPSAGEIVQPRVTISGGEGSGATGLVLLDAPIDELIILDGGSGYAPNAPVTFTPVDGGAGAAATANVDGGGTITGFKITNRGSGYRQSPTASIAGGTGADVLVTIGPSQIESIEVTNGGSGYATEPTVTIDPPRFQAKWVKGGTKVTAVSGRTVTLCPCERAANYAKDTWVYLCSGPAFDEADGRYYLVQETDDIAGEVTFYQAVRSEDVIENQTCLVPGPFINGLTVRNIQFAGLNTDARNIGALAVGEALNVTIDNVRTIDGDESHFADVVYMRQSQCVSVRNCFCRLEVAVCHEFHISASTLTGYITHLFASDFVFSDCLIYGPVRPWFATYNFIFRDCRFFITGDQDFSAWDSADLSFDRCVLSYNAAYYAVIDGPRLRWNDVSVSAGKFHLGSQCIDCVLENVRLHNPIALEFDAGSSGKYVNVSPHPAVGPHWTTRPSIYEFTRSPVGPDVNDWIEVGHIISPLSNAWVKLNISIDGYAGASRLYLISMNNDITVSTWYVVPPTANAGRGRYFTPHDFNLEAKRVVEEDVHTLFLRVRKTQSYAGGVSARIQLETDGEFTPTSSTGSDSSTLGAWPNLLFGSMLTLSEIATPDAPTANSAVLFAKDNGSGKTQFCVRFPTGGPIVLATEA